MHTIELSDEELRLLHEALHSFLDDFGHDEMDVVRALKALLAKLPERPGGRVIVRLALWNLADSLTTVGELRRVLRDEAADAFADVEGLRLTLWVADETTERWGALHVFETREDADAELPTRLGELIGRPPDIFEEWDLEAAAEARFASETLSLRGLAFEG